MERILIIAGSDSSGGAGIQADIKTITVLGGFATTAITALTAQNTKGVTSILPVSDTFVADQMRAILSDIGADIIKTGMLYSREIIETIVNELEPYNTIPIVVDPVMISTSGHHLLKPDAIETLKQQLLPKAFAITPNLPEAALLLDKESIDNTEDAVKALYDRYGCHYILLKGGHMTGNTIEDILFDGQQVRRYPHKRIITKHTHGTGCTLASALATFLAKGYSATDATKEALVFVQKAIKTAPEIGEGNGPLGLNLNTLLTSLEKEENI